MITYTIGSSSMRFCYHDYDYKGKKLPKQHYFMLNEDEALVWLPVRSPRAHTRPAPGTIHTMHTRTLL